MKLSRLEIFGFKSFGKKLDLKLLGGITSVVGPNGCGKTNVVDSIRWVLGEQRPTHIRLEKMEDVIYKGSETRRPLGMAEVSLTIENSAGVLPFDLNEITVTRRLFRSGESEYLMNRKQCRLSDITELFMDTGIGLDSYSVFEQGMINAILSDKTEDRRHIFEEAAGVTKYKSRRKSALTTLVSIDDDLTRLSDITTELERRVDSLKRQASKASRYRELKSELKARTINLAVYEIEALKHKIAYEFSEIENYRSQITSLRNEIVVFEKAVSEINSEMSVIEQELTGTAARYDENTRAISDRESERARLESRIESLAEIAMRAQENVSRNKASLECLAEDHGKCSENLEFVEKNLSAGESLLREKQEKTREAEKSLGVKLDSVRVLEQEFRALEREIASDRSGLENIRVRRSDGEKRLAGINSRMEELEDTIVRSNEEILSFKNKKLRLLSEKNTHSDKLSDLKNTLREKQEALSLLDKEHMTALKNLASLKAEHDFLSELVKSYRGYSDGVRNSINSSELKNKTAGVLADLVATDAEYEKAVEAVLFSNLQNIIVKDGEAALDGAKYLAQGKLGRAVFVPADEKKPSRYNFAVLTGLDGVIGPVKDFVRVESIYQQTAERIIGPSVIVKTLEDAWRLGRSLNDFNFVTLTGEMVGRNGEVHAGYHTAESGKTSLGRIEKLEKLAASLSRAETLTESLDKKRAVLSEEFSELREELTGTEKTLEEVSAKLAEINSGEARASAKNEASSEALETLRTEAKKTRESLKEFDVSTIKLEERIRENSAKFDNLDSKLREFSEEVGEIRTNLSRLRNELNGFEVEKAGLKEKKLGLVREIEVIRERRESLAQSIRRIQKEIEDAESESLSVGDRKKILNEEIHTLSSSHGELEMQKRTAEARYLGLKALLREKESRMNAVRDNLSGLVGQESRHVIEKDESIFIMNNIAQRLADEYFINLDEIPSPEEDWAIDSETEKLALTDLRKRIAGLGDVNLSAEKDYNEEKVRLDFFESERKDLSEAKESLIETIAKINEIANARFLQTFEKIKLNFHTTFHDFFEGGTCDLELEQGKDPLEADILITARPPGKNVRSISLLSSGERALTAISLLFAIYMVKPSPFCILDEVDAPLDDANIDRFLRVIKEFSKNTQFMMVTHNKKTMANADNLYGITMEEPGLSGLVSVRLSEVDSYIDPSDRNKTNSGISEKTTA